MDIKELLRQAVRFSLVGVVNTLLDMCVFYFLTRLPLFVGNYVLAQVISYSCGVACSLTLNRLWTFKRREALTLRQAMLFFLVNLAALGISSLTLCLCQMGELPPMLSKAVSVPFSLGANFTGNKLFVFKD